AARAYPPDRHRRCGSPTAAQPVAAVRPAGAGAGPARAVLEQWRYPAVAAGIAHTLGGVGTGSAGPGALSKRSGTSYRSLYQSSTTLVRKRHDEKSSSGTILRNVIPAGHARRPCTGWDNGSDRGILRKHHYLPHRRPVPVRPHP